MNDWFEIEQIDEKTFIISEYRHWEETHCYLLNGTERSLLIDTGLGICNILDKLPSAEDLSELLRSVGGKTNMEEIGLDPALKATTLRYSPYVRARLTMMRLRKLLGFTE